MKNNWLPFEIAGGILLAFAVITAVERYQENQAIEQFNRVIQSTLNTMPTPSTYIPAPRIEATSYAQAMQQASKNRPMADLPDDERCIGKQLFRKLPNGFEQITDGSEKICVNR